MLVWHRETAQQLQGAFELVGGPIEIARRCGELTAGVRQG
jgi:hypothetical protein